MTPGGSEMASQGVKIGLGAMKIDLLSTFCIKKCNPPMLTTHFYRFFVILGVLLGGIFGEKIDEKSLLFSMLFF